MEEAARERVQVDGRWVQRWSSPRSIGACRRQTGRMGQGPRSATSATRNDKEGRVHGEAKAQRGRDRGRGRARVQSRVAAAGSHEGRVLARVGVQDGTSGA